jgi:hypothetical protein
MIKKEKKNIENAVVYHQVLEGGLDEVVTFNAETVDVACFFVGEIFRSGDSGDEDLFLTMAPKLAGTSGGWFSESNAGSISGERSDDAEVVGAVGGEHIGFG